jgi:hypothetical protein
MIPAGSPIILKLRKAAPRGRYILTLTSGRLVTRQTITLTR